MRLWHKDLIPVLPRQQLLGQWRECCGIAHNISVFGSPKHILVNRIMDYPLEHFHYYASIVADEMKERGYKCDFSNFTDYIKLEFNHCTYDKLFVNWHDYRYLNQCFYNLQEKYDCGSIPFEDWDNISELMCREDARHKYE